MLQILLLLAVIIIGVLFLLTEQKVLTTIQPGNRLIAPGWVWLQLIPIVGQIWQFFIVSYIAGSIRKEIESRQEDSILGLSEADIAHLGKSPTLAIGIAYCALNVIGLLINTLLTLNPASPLLDIALLILLGGVVCWIIYWVKLGQYRSKLTLGRI